ncbi:MAG TPA: hypothetical protein DDW87_14850 [Firmicutes bacterium]|nr:hypothetical protein [Bacillota bacterium]
MIALAQLDVLRALKRCLCLTEQDLVFCDYLSNSNYWKDYALARYGTYRWLQAQVEQYGVNHTYLLAAERYADLPLFASGTKSQGEQEALEVFFQFIAGESPIRAQIHA